MSTQPTNENPNPPLSSSDLARQLRTQADDMRCLYHLALYADRCDAAADELEAYRDGGLTEDILRRNGGYIKVGRGCVIALESDMPNAAGEPQPRKP